MQHISKAAIAMIISSARSFRRRLKPVLIECLIASLILALNAGTHPAAARPRYLHPSATSRSSFATQFLLEELEIIAQGQALMREPTREAIIQALAKFKEAFARSQKKGNKLAMGAARLWEGIAYDSIVKPREALNAFLDASRYFKEAGFGFMNPMVYVLTGTAYAKLGETDKALDYLNHAVSSLRLEGIPQIFVNLLKALGYDKDQVLVYALKCLGDVNVDMGRKSKGLEYLSEALGLYQQRGDGPNEILTLALISAFRTSIGQLTEAIKTARAVIERSKENGASDWEAYGYLALGAAYTAAGNLDQAVTDYNEALRLSRAQKDRSLEALVLNNLGLIYANRGDFNRALDYFEEVLRLSKSINDPKPAAYAASNIGVIYSKRGDPVEAFRYFKEALDFAVSHKDRKLEAGVLSSMSDTYFLINNPNYSLKLLKDAAAIFKEIEDAGHEAEVLISIADRYATMGRYEEALDALNSVLKSRGIAEDPGRQGYVLREIGGIYYHLGDRGKALTYFEESLTKLEAAGYDIGKVELYMGWGVACMINGDYQKADDLFSKGLALARTNGLRQSESLILLAFGYLRENQGNPAQAESFYDQQIVVSESLHSSARIEEIKTGAGDIFAPLLSPAILLKLRLGKSSEAFELTERARARTFLDQMNNARIDARKGADPQLVEREQSLLFDISSLEEKLRKERRSNPRSEAVSLMAASLKEKEASYAALLIQLKASNPEYAQLRSYSPVPLSEIQKLLDPQTTLVSYFVAKNETLAFVIRSDAFEVVELPVREVDLRGAIDWFRDFASLRDPDPSSLKRLHGWLIAPILQRIKTSQVIIVPHGILHYVPFAALTDGHRYFGDDHTIHHLPSASVLPSLRRRTGGEGRRILSLSQSQASGLSSLRYVDEEASSVARLYNVRSLLTGRATRAEFLKRASHYDMLHIAAHAELNQTSPLFSRIHLASEGDESGAIEVREVYGMSLARTNLVVLSACETQLGAQSRGDDIVGLNRAFIYAGASFVIASLWTVDDKATSLLMKTFYSHLKRGRSKAAALQAAQIATRRKYPHPYYWAGFVLTGDPGKR